MFLDVNELAVRKTRIRKSYAPGTLDFHSGEFRQVEPLEVRATALEDVFLALTNQNIPVAQ